MLGNGRLLSVETLPPHIVGYSIGHALFTGSLHMLHGPVGSVGFFSHVGLQTHCAPPTSTPDAVPNRARAHSSKQNIVTWLALRFGISKLDSCLSQLKRSFGTLILSRV